MKKRFIAILLCLAMLLSFAACKAKKEEEPLPTGVVENYGGRCYVVKLPEGSQLEDLFQLTGEPKTTMMQELNSAELTQVYTQSTQGGGRVAYTQGSDVILYIPATYTGTVAQAVSKLYYNSENYMSPEEAAQYIDELK